MPLHKGRVATNRTTYLESLLLWAYGVIRSGCPSLSQQGWRKYAHMILTRRMHCMPWIPALSMVFSFRCYPIGLGGWYTWYTPYIPVIYTYIRHVSWGWSCSCWSFLLSFVIEIEFYNTCYYYILLLFWFIARSNPYHRWYSQRHLTKAPRHDKPLAAEIIYLPLP